MARRTRISLLVASIVFAASFVNLRPPVAEAAGPVVEREKVGVSLYGSALGWSDQKLEDELDRVRSMGARWVRVPFNWATLEMHGRGRYNWGPADRVVREAKERHLFVLAVVSYTPGWARPAGTPATNPPRKYSDYANFLYAAAKRYGPQGVHRWEIWNEPNLHTMWTPTPSASQYTALLKGAYRALHRADRYAVVITGGLSPAYDARNRTQIAPYTFLSKIYAYGGRGSFDQVGLHPYTFPYRATQPGDWNTFGQATRLYSLMRSKGDGGKRVTATEVGFPTGTSDRAVSESAQATYTVEAAKQWQAYSFDAPLFVYSNLDEGTNIGNHYENFGLARYNGQPKPAYSALRAALLGA
jgi:hypothetical protein